MNNSKKKIDDDEKIIIDVLINEINTRRKAMKSRQETGFKIMTAFLIALFPIISYALKEENYYFLYSIIPFFIASGYGLILHQERIVYAIAIYVKILENQLNILLGDNYLKWEFFASKINNDNKTRKIDAILHFITLFPFVGIYLFSLTKIYELYRFEYAISIIIIYLLILLSLIYITHFLTFRKYYDYINELIKKI